MIDTIVELIPDIRRSRSARSQPGVIGPIAAAGAVAAVEARLDRIRRHSLAVAFAGKACQGCQKLAAAEQKVVHRG